MRSQHLVIEAGDTERFRAFVTRWLGFELDDEKLWSLSDILRRRVREKGGSAQAYLSCLENSHPFSDELRTLAHELTINETFFFRNADQMAAFADVALPERLAAQSASRKLRILSAGCASGEEAYSLAMIIHNLPQAAGYDISITGVDADTNVLKKAAGARYSAWSLRQTPPPYRADFFKAEKQEFALCDTIRGRVIFEERNLVVEDPAFWAPGTFDIVFCRNVIMYFTPDVARSVVARIAGSLVPGGFLFLGTAETLRSLSDHFHLRHTHGTFYYQRHDTAHRLRPDEGWDDAALSIVPDSGFVEAIDGATRRIRSLKAAGEQTRPTARKGKKKETIDLDPVIELFRSERMHEALALLSEFSSEASQDSRVLLLTAVLLTHGGDVARAERVCAALLSRDECNSGAHYLMALCRESSGDYAGAMACDQAAARFDPVFAMPHLHMGLMARRTGDWASARRELSKAATLIPCEDNARLLLFGGGFNREALSGLCQAELSACGGAA